LDSGWEAFSAWAAAFGVVVVVVVVVVGPAETGVGAPRTGSEVAAEKRYAFAADATVELA
jgi:hypothetical protein